MSDLTREEAIEEIKSWTPILMFSGQCTEKTSKAQEMAISALSADVRENIHAYWVEHLNQRGVVLAIHCSHCKKAPRNCHRTDYCPSCGAIMDGEPKREKGE